MQVINYTLSFKALRIFVDNFNKNEADIKRRLRTSHNTLLEVLIKVYSTELIKCQKRNFDINNVPVYTNNTKLAKILKCSERTIQRYLNRICDSKAITKKVFRGTKHDYELYLNPQIFIVNNLASKQDAAIIDFQIKKEIQKLQNQQITQNLSLSQSATDCRLINDNSNTLLDKLNECGKLEQPTNPPSKFILKNSINSDMGDHVEKMGDHVPGVVNFNERKIAAPEQSLIKDFIERLWAMCFIRFYSHLVFMAPSQVRFAKTFFAHEFMFTEQKNYYKKFTELQTRIVQAETWANKNKFKIPLPDTYFSEKFKHSFHNTKVWFEVSKVNYVKYTDSKTKFDSNNKFQAFQKEYLKNPSLLIFNRTVKKISRLGQPELLKKFLETSTNPKIYA